MIRFSHEDRKTVVFFTSSMKHIDKMEIKTKELKHRNEECVSSFYVRILLKVEDE